MGDGSRNGNGRGTGGQFLPGNTVSIGNKGGGRPSFSVPCPEGLKAIGMEGLWRRLVKSASGGDKGSLHRIFELTEKHGLDGQGGRLEHLKKYGGIRVDAASLLYSLDCDLESLVRRYERGLPCSDVEVLIAESALSMVGPRHHAKTVLADRLVAEVQELRALGLVPEGVPEAWRTGSDPEAPGE